MGLKDVLSDDAKRAAIVSDCCKLIDDEVSDKGGLSGIVVKTGYAAVKGVKPGFIESVVKKLLPEFTEKLDGIWEEGVKTGKPADHLVANKGRVADALLSVTDARAKSSSGVVKGTYDKLRGSAKKHVEDAVPRLSKLLAKHVA